MRIGFLGFCSVLLVSLANGAEQPEYPTSVYVYLNASIGDHVNMDITEDRLRRVLPMIEKYRAAHPEAHVSATILFTGAVSQALAERNRETKILDFVLDFIQRGIIEAGYDGTAEPTFIKRPLVDMHDTKSAEDRWQVRANVAERFLTEARDPLTGDPQAGKAGGLKKMQKVFGEASAITGLTLFASDAFTGVAPQFGADSETIQQLRRLNTKAILFGIPDANPGHVPAIHEWAGRFSKAMSPSWETSPDLYWQEDILRSSEMSGMDHRLVHASDGVDGVKALFDKLDKFKTRVVHLELGNDRNYLTPGYSRGVQYPPVRFAYGHPDRPNLPAEARRPTADVDAAYAREEAVMTWLTEQYFHAHLGSRVVSNGFLKQIAGPATGYSVKVETLRYGLGDLVKGWGNDTALPKYLRVVESHYLSLAEMFQVMADALAGLNRSGKLPDSVQVVPVFGPIETQMERGPSGEVTAASVARVCAGLVDALHDQTWAPIPRNAVPSHVTIDNITLNPAQFLRLMAEALVAPSPDTKLTIKPTDIFWGRDAVYYKTRSLADEGGTWTVKPAPLIFAAIAK